MKRPTYNELSAALGAEKQNAHLFRMALRWMLEETENGCAAPLPIYQVYTRDGNLVDSAPASIAASRVPGIEHYAFYAFELDQPHGGIILISHTVYQPSGQKPLVTESVHYLDDLWSTTQKDPGGSWYKLAAPALERARRKRDAA